MLRRRVHHFRPCAVLVLTALLNQAVRAAEFKFAFGPSAPQAGFTQVSPQMTYDKERGFGFLNAVAPGQPSVFAVAVEEGNYDVTIRFGDPARATATTIKAE